jgi:hypothetical protein
MITKHYVESLRLINTNPTKNLGVIPCSLERYTVPAPLLAPIVVLLLKI